MGTHFSDLIYDVYFGWHLKTTDKPTDRVYFNHLVTGSAPALTLGAGVNNVFHVFRRFLCAWGLDDILHVGLCNLLPCKQKLHHDFMLLRVFYPPGNNIPLLFIDVPGHKAYWQVSNLAEISTYPFLCNRRFFSVTFAAEKSELKISLNWNWQL